ncbi:hypothetical protein A6J76_008835 [Aggregatibacter aphrophilus]|nr:hypothetical protein A6J76_008835 [Aggregatibacter aphrophilus]
MTHNQIKFGCSPRGAVGKANVQNPLDFVTALFSCPIRQCALYNAIGRPINNCRCHQFEFDPLV